LSISFFFKIKKSTIIFIYLIDLWFIARLKWIEAPTLFSVPVGRYVKFQCRTVGNAKAKKIWLKNEKPITANQKYIINANTLTINNIELSDGGIYVCQIENKYQTLNINYTLNVLEMPAHDQPVRQTSDLQEEPEPERDSISKSANCMFKRN
jgi:hypothetical protein